MPDAAESERGVPTTIQEAVGGPLGMAESAVPGAAFVIAYVSTGSDMNIAAAVAVGIALVLTAARLVRRESPRQALSGLVGVGIAAFIATRSGKAENFFLPGLLLNLAYAMGLLVSIAVRWPLVGVVVTKLDGEDNAWREDPRRMRAFRRATLLFAAMFSARLVVQLPLYFAGSLVALGVAKTAMGLPLFALALWLIWLLVRGVRTPAPPAQA